MNQIKLIRDAALALALTGMLAGPIHADNHGAAATPPEAAEFKAAIEKAEAAQKKAGSVDGEWRDTGKIIKKAKAAAKKGDYTKALELANSAYRQGELGYQQAIGQKNAGFPSYMR